VNQSYYESGQGTCFNIESNAYETLILVYNRELDLLVSASSITKSNVEEESSPPYPKDVVTNLKEDMTNSKDTTSAATSQPTNGT
jgi:hypothetical protein